MGGKYRQRLGRWWCGTWRRCANHTFSLSACEVWLTWLRATDGVSISTPPKQRAQPRRIISLTQPASNHCHRWSRVGGWAGQFPDHNNISNLTSRGGSTTVDQQSCAFSFDQPIPSTSSLTSGVELKAAAAGWTSQGSPTSSGPRWSHGGTRGCTHERKRRRCRLGIKRCFLFFYIYFHFDL